MSEYQNVLPGTTPLVAIALMDMAVSMVCGEKTVRNNDIRIKLSNLKTLHTDDIPSLKREFVMWLSSIQN